MSDLASRVGATHLLITGGRAIKAAAANGDSQAPKRPDRVTYDRAIIGVVDLATGEVEQALNYEPTTTEWDWRNQNVNFKYGTLDHKGNLLVVTESQLLTVSLAGFDVREVYSSPEFNDLHSVHILDDALALTCTGRDLILFVADNKVLDRRIDTKQAQWVQDSAVTTVDWRERNTQPHDTHPNYFWMHDGAAWVTRGNRGDIVRVDSQERMVISNKVVHDGFFTAGSWWATSVNGFVHELDPEGNLIRSINVGQVLEPKDLRPGWCRGLHVTEDLLIVGFSAIRATRLRRNLEWLASAGQHRDRAPTQVAFIDRASGGLVKSVRVDGAEIHSIFSTIPVNL